MRRTTSLLCTFGMLAAGLLSQARAQQTSTEHGTRADLDEIRKISALRKAEVHNQANEKIASVTDLILSPDGKVRYAVLSVGGVVGIGAKYTAIPWEKLDIRHVDNKWAVNLPLSKEVLEHAPLIESDNYRELTNAQWVSRVREYFATQLGPASAKDTDRKTDTPEPMTTFLRASKVLGATLRNAQSENLGRVEDLLLDRNSKVAFAIVGHGGVLGIGESYIPAPWSKVKLTDRPEDAGLVATIDSTKEQMEKAPLVKGDTYATMLAPGFTDQVYRFFGMDKQ
jgi:sporulation protein YlmC with PRC-barrel domain